MNNIASSALPKLPPGFEWDLRTSSPGEYILVLIPAEGYEWAFPLNPNTPRDAVYYVTSVRKPASSEDLEAAAKNLLVESLGPTRVLKPKVRKKDA